MPMRSWPKTAKAKLRSIASKLEIEFEHHDALEDARTAGKILLRAIMESGTCLEDWFSRSLLPIGREAGRLTLESNPTGALFGEYLVFTGALQIPRREASEFAAHIGCTVMDSITKKTSLLVVGDQDISRLSTGRTKSSKHRKAEALIEAGIPIRIIGETDFMLLCSAEPAQTERG